MGAVAKAVIDDVDVRGRRVLVRVDFNVPIRDGRIVDDRRIREALPTIESIRARGGRVILVSHLGRPGGAPDPALSIRPLAGRLSELLGGTEVRVARDVAGPAAAEIAASLEDGEVGMLENVRFDPGEEGNDDQLARRLAALADLYCNDAFGAAHRAHASTEGVAHHLPAYAGRLMLRELEVLGTALEAPGRPFVAIVGGAKISSKIGVVDNLLERVDTLWIGGAMACTFYLAQGESTGTSLVEKDQVETARRLLDQAAAGRANLRLPTDCLVVEKPEEGAATEVVSWREIPDGRMAVDAGPASVAAMAGDVEAAATVMWNGPLGIYEIDAFAQGTRRVAEALGRSTATTIVGGGDLAAAIEDAGVAGDVSHISTGGGATLEFLEGRVLPGVAALRDRETS
ncbi:MAG: phosphoglycerate kinase [Candidatus Dormibacteria bacterium]